MTAHHADAGYNAGLLVDEESYALIDLLLRVVGPRILKNKRVRRRKLAETLEALGPVTNATSASRVMDALEPIYRRLHAHPPYGLAMEVLNALFTAINGAHGGYRTPSFSIGLLIGGDLARARLGDDEIVALSDIVMSCSNNFSAARVLLGGE